MFKLNKHQCGKNQCKTQQKKKSMQQVMERTKKTKHATRIATENAMPTRVEKEEENCKKGLINNFKNGRKKPNMQQELQR